MFGGLSLEGSLSGGVSVWGGSLSKESLSGGSLSGGLCQETTQTETQIQ